MGTNTIINNLLVRSKDSNFDYSMLLDYEILGRTICAFLNGTGGQLLIGRDDKGEAFGIDNAEQLKKEIETYLLENIVPEAPISVSVEGYKKCSLLLVRVWAGNNQPYVYDGAIYYRQDAISVRASSEQISDLIHKRSESELHWERQLAISVNLEDLDISQIKKTMQVAIENNRTGTESKDILDFLSYYGLYRNSHFTNAAVVLFAYNPAKFIPQVRTRVSLLLGGKTSAIYDDDRLLEGNLFQNIDDINSFFDRHLNRTRNFDDNDWKRKDTAAYPISALREGVMNALIHRDYSHRSDSLSIIIYDRSIEMVNSGKLPYDVTELKRNHLSLPKNPDIAHIVFLRGYIEKIGRGTLKIINACKDAGLKAPVWTINDNIVKLAFYSNVSIDNITDRAIDRTIDRTTDRAIDGAIDGATDGATDSVKSKMALLLKAVIANEGKRNDYYVKATGIPIGSIGRYLKTLKDAEFIVFDGESTKTGGYYVTGKLKDILNIK